MSVIKSMRKQKAVWWSRGDVDEYGSFTYAEPVQVDCRWEDKAGQFRNPKGEIFASKAVVYVDRPMKIGDKLKRGPMDSNTLDDPKGDPDAFEIQTFEQIPNFRNTEVLYTAGL